MYENLPHSVYEISDEENNKKWKQMALKIEEKSRFALKRAPSSFSKMLFLTLKVLWPRNKLIAFRPHPHLHASSDRAEKILSSYGLPNIITAVRRKALFGYEDKIILCNSDFHSENFQRSCVLDEKLFKTIILIKFTALKLEHQVMEPASHRFLLEQCGKNMDNCSI